MGSVSAFPAAKLQGVSVNHNMTSAYAHICAATGCLHLQFDDKTQRDAFASGLKIQGTRHDTSGELTIRIFYSNNR